LRVKDLMVPIKKAAVLKDTDSLKDLIFEVSAKKQGIALVKKGAKIIGVFTDGDLRRQLKKNIQIEKVKLNTVISKKFQTIKSDALVVEAAKTMKKFKVYTLVVEEKNNIVGIISMHDILEANVL
jgi:arabinose-5-phosphate isomerase